MGVRFIGWGAAVPDRVVTNDELSKTMETSDEWIRERTGIHRRHVGGSTMSLSVESARKAIAMAGLQPSDIDGLVLATTTPDRQVPATSAAVARELGLTCGAFDINAACSGFVYALAVAHGLIAIGSQKVLLVGTDTLSRITDWTDRNTAVLFADGSGAAVLEAVDGEIQPVEDRAIGVDHGVDDEMKAVGQLALLTGLRFHSLCCCGHSAPP